MSETRFITDQLERAYRGPAWHGPALREALDGVDAATAAARPLADAHSIWEIVHHLAVWYDVPRRRIAGEAIEKVPANEDWPAVGELSEAAWSAALARLDGAHGALVAAARGLDDADLERPVAGSDPTVRGLLLGVIQHDVYHAGQIVLLGRAAGGGR